MRVAIRDIERPKLAAKKLSSFLPDTPLSVVQGQLATSLGYVDWHELHTQPKASVGSQLDHAQIANVIVEIADGLNMLPGDVQFALASARLFRSLGLQDQLALRSTVWRRLMGPSARNKAGSVVRDQTSGKGTPAYLRRFGRPTYLLFDSGPGMRGDFEVVQPRSPLPDFVPARLWLPYGCWTTRDGADVFFSRDYLPLWRVTSRSVERMEPWLWIEGIVGEHHYGGSVWATGPARDNAIAALTQRGLVGLPMLVDTMQILMKSDVSKIGEAAYLLMQDRAGMDRLRPGTSINPWHRPL